MRAVTSLCTPPRQARASTETLQLEDGRSFRPGVCRTAYVFPGIGLGVIMSRSTRVRDEMILAAAKARPDAFRCRISTV